MVILGITLGGTILAVTLGSILYVKPNMKKSIEFAGGAEYVVKIEAGTGAQAKKIATDVAQSIYERIDALGTNGASVEPEIKSSGATVRIQYPGLTTPKEIGDMKSMILDKPHLTMTDMYGNLLFDRNGNFDTSLIGRQPGRPKISDADYIDAIKQSQVPIASGGAKAQFTQAGKWETLITLKNGKEGEWTAATQYISKLQKGLNQVVVWLNLEKLVNEQALAFPGEWAAAAHNPFSFVHVDSKPANILRSSVFDGSQYLISSASVTKPLNGRTFVIEGSMTAKEVSSLARKISYGVSNYTLKLVSSNHVGATYGSHAFQKAMIAGLIVFSLIAVFLMVNYGLLGALSTISIGLYMFLTLLMFTIMRGEYSPETIAALIIGIGMSVDANIITFERLKNEVYKGSSVKKAHSRAQKQSLSTIFDANVTTMIVAFVLFFFGTRNIIGLSVMLILSIFFTLIVMLIFTRILSTVLVNTGYFDERKHLLGINKKFDKFVQTKISKPDYVATSKWFSMGSAAIISIAVIVFAVFAGIAGSLAGGFNLSQGFTGGTVISISNKTKDANGASLKLTQSDYQDMRKKLAAQHISAEDITTIYAVGHDNDPKFVTGVKIKTTKDITAAGQSLLKEYSKSTSAFTFYIATTTTDVAKALVKDAMFAILIAMALIVVYTLIRFKWTYSFAAIVALVHDGLIVTAVFVIARVQISPVFVAGLLSVIGYSINDTIVTFDRIREKMSEHTGELDKAKIKGIANAAIKDTMKRSLLTSLTTIVAVLILMSFGNATKFTFNLAMLVGLVAGTYSSIFIATYLWVGLESFRVRKIAARKTSTFWKTKGVEEQTFEGINDYHR